MKSQWVVCLLFAASAMGQEQWKHELVYKGAWAIERDERYAWVNAAGQYAYTLKGPEVPIKHAFLGKTDITKLYLGEPSEGFASGINRSGQAVQRAHTIGALHVSVENRDFLSEVYGPREGLAIGVAGVDESGSPVWYTYAGSAKPDRLFHGTRELTVGKFIQYGSLALVQMNPAGRTVWSGIDLVMNRSDVFYDDANYSYPILGAGGAGLTAKLNERGDILWSGFGVNTGMKKRLFLNDREISSAIWPDAKQVYPLALNNNHMLWRVYYNNVNITMFDDQILGGEFSNLVDALFPFMNENGDVGWIADLLGDGMFVFRNHENMSRDLLGAWDISDRYLDTLGIDDSGRVLWHGSGANTHHKLHVFVNKFDLTMDALGHDDYSFAFGNKIGPNGHTLWHVGYNDGTVDLWLSTPVPEPSLLPALAGAMGLVAWRRRSPPKERPC